MRLATLSQHPQASTRPSTTLAISPGVSLVARENSQTTGKLTLRAVLASMALVWIMIPGVGLFYSGLLRRKNALSMIYLSMAGVAVGSFQWFFWGYSLAFADNASK